MKYSEKPHEILKSIFSKDTMYIADPGYAVLPKWMIEDRSIDLRNKYADPFFKQPETIAAFAKFWEACFEIKALPERIANRMMREEYESAEAFVRATEVEPLEENREALRNALEMLLGAVNSGTTLDEAKQAAYSALAESNSSV